jgi:hypothetical protein
MASETRKPVINDETLYEARAEFRYPRPAADEPSEAFLRAIRAIDVRLPFIVAAEFEEVRSSATEHLTYEHSDPYERRTESREGDFVPAAALDDRIAELRGEA